MKFGRCRWVLILIVAAIMIAPAAALADLSPDMSQGAFALWLVKAIGASGKLPPAATEQDAIDFLLKLGVYPEGGWDKDAPISTDFLASLLGEDEPTGTFEELVDRVKDYVQGLFDSSSLGVFRAAGSGSSGVVVVG